MIDRVEGDYDSDDFDVVAAANFFFNFEWSVRCGEALEVLSKANRDRVACEKFQGASMRSLALALVSRGQSIGVKHDLRKAIAKTVLVDGNRAWMHRPPDENDHLLSRPLEDDRIHLVIENSRHRPDSYPVPTTNEEREALSHYLRELRARMHDFEQPSEERLEFLRDEGRLWVLTREDFNERQQ